MLTDAVLREATAEAECFLMSLVPEEGEPHVFSKRFERKMQKLIRRANHPLRYQVMRVAAAAILTVAVLFGAVMAISPEARAAVVGWIKETFGIYVQYSNEQICEYQDAAPVANAKMTARAEYHLAVIPEGYRELHVIEKLDGKIYLYTNDDDQVLQFTYTYGAEYSRLFVDIENYKHYPAYVNDCKADIYIAVKEHETCSIVWQDPQTGVLFEIFALANPTELLELAGTVVKKST